MSGSKSAVRQESIEGWPLCSITVAKLLTGVYVTGSTGRTDFPVTALAYQKTKNAGTDAFVTKFDADAQDLSDHRVDVSRWAV